MDFYASSAFESPPRERVPPLHSAIFQSLNSKQRQLRKSGNELMPNDAAELLRVSTEQQALQKHLEAARKQARQHSMLIQVRKKKKREVQSQRLTF